MSPASLAALVPTQWKAGDPSPNPTGKPKTKPITDAMRLLLAGDREAFIALPVPLRRLCGAWYRHAMLDPRGLALLLDRIEGRIEDAPPRPLPSISFIEQHFDNVHVTNGKAEPRIVESTDIPGKRG